jgi:uncharacterized GH25 family protein
MFKPRVLVVLLAFLLTVTACVRAHEIKALASQLTLEKAGEKTTIYLSWGHRLPVDDLIDGDSLTRYDLVAPGGAVKALNKADLSLQTNVVELKDEGIHQVIVSKKPAVFTIVTDTEGEPQFKRGPKSQIKEGAIDHAFRREQFAKALIVVGAAKGSPPKPVGLPLEIVPLDGPTKWRSGRDLCFKVLFQGKVVAWEQVLATHVGFTPDTAWCFATETDNQGVATIRARKAGVWVVVVKVRKLTKGKTREQYDYEDCTATLTLEVRP